MDGSGKITLEWGDGENAFRLDLKRLRDLQDKTGVGPEALYRRVATGDWRIEDLRETIRLGLVGGGMDEVKAAKLMRSYFDDGPYLKHKPMAIAILLAAMMGPPDDPIPAGKTEREREASESLSQNTLESQSQSV